MLHMNQGLQKILVVTCKTWLDFITNQVNNTWHMCNQRNESHKKEKLRQEMDINRHTNGSANKLLSFQKLFGDSTIKPFTTLMKRLTCESFWIIKLMRLPLQRSLHLPNPQYYLALAHSPPSNVATYNKDHKFTTLNYVNHGFWCK